MSDICLPGGRFYIISASLFALVAVPVLSCTILL